MVAILSNFSTKWFEGLDPDKKKIMQDLLNGNNMVLSKLKEILSKELKTLEISETSEKDFDPSWPYRSARRVGEKAGYLKILKIIGANYDQ